MIRYQPLRQAGFDFRIAVAECLAGSDQGVIEAPPFGIREGFGGQGRGEMVKVLQRPEDLCRLPSKVDRLIKASLDVRYRSVS